MNDLVGQISKIQRLVRLVFLHDAPKAMATGLPKIVGDVLVIIKQSNERGEFEASLFSSLF